MLVGVYLPAVGRRIQPIFQELLSITEGLVARKALLTGDFNTGITGIDNTSGRFTCSNEMIALKQQGWVDTWRSRHGELREFSWYSSAGNAFRIDHAFASPQLADFVENAEYDHEVRVDRLSDHSVLSLELKMLNVSRTSSPRGS